MKLKILHFSLLFAATTAKDVYVEGATTDSPGAAAVVPAAKLGANESANYEYDEDAATDSPGAEAVVPAAKLNGVKNEALAANHRRTAWWDPSAEEACENHDFSKAECQNVGCCEWYTCPITSVGGDSVGQCIGAAALNVLGPDACTSVPWRIAGRWNGPTRRSSDLLPR